jgi:hypothetical protein
LADTIAKGASSQLQRIEETGQSLDQLTAGLFLFAVSRPPTAEEIAAVRELLGQQPTVREIEDLFWAVFMLPEFQLVR